MATKKTTKAKSNGKSAAKMVLVRTYSAGVHFGRLSARRGQEVDLVDARRIWNWNGANTLHEVATAGVDVARSKVSGPVSAITLTQAIEILDMTPAAVEVLGRAKWA